jgi:hypothetical protein
MIDLVQTSASLPSVFVVRPAARARMRDFFSSHIRNSNTRRAYMEAVRQFSGFCAEIGVVAWPRSSRCMWRRLSRRSPSFTQNPPSRFAWPPCVCFSTGWWSARSFPSIRRTRYADEAHAAAGENPSTAGRRGQHPAGFNRHHFPARPARSRLDRSHGLHLRPPWFRCGSKIILSRDAGAGFACTRKAARNMKCPRTTIWTATLRSTSPAPASLRTGRDRDTRQEAAEHILSGSR